VQFLQFFICIPILEQRFSSTSGILEMLGNQPINLLGFGKFGETLNGLIHNLALKV
jgi:hypothetical protein